MSNAIADDRVTVIETREEVADLARGMVLLGTGGGGDPLVGELLLGGEIEQGRCPRIVTAESLDDDAFVLTICGIGAPTVLLEGLISRTTMLELVRQTEEFFGRKIDALISIEIGGLNTLFPLAIGAALDIPVIDGDGIGRAFPHVEMTAFGILGCPSTPAVIMDESGNCVILKSAKNDRTAEDIARAMSASLGAMVWGSFYPMTGRQVKAVGVHGTITQARNIGRHIRNARLSEEDVVGSTIAHLNSEDRLARLLYKGKVTDVARETRGGWDYATIRIESADPAEGVCTLELQNEFSIAYRDGDPLCMVPDMICVVHSETGEPLTGEMLTFGQRVSLIGYAAHPIFRRAKSIDVCGPRQFGIDLDFVPLERLGRGR